MLSFACHFGYCSTIHIKSFIVLLRTKIKLGINPCFTLIKSLNIIPSMKMPIFGFGGSSWQMLGIIVRFIRD
jgi:hypothetical protein